jgi:hypothetical protein
VEQGTITHGFGHTWGNCYAMSLTSGLKTFLYSLRKGYYANRCLCRSWGLNIVTPFGFFGFVGNVAGDLVSVLYWIKF